MATDNPADGPLRVYTGYRDDQDGAVLCAVHRGQFYRQHPRATEQGEWGGDCERCPTANRT